MLVSNDPSTAGGKRPSETSCDAPQSKKSKASVGSAGGSSKIPKDLAALFLPLECKLCEVKMMSNVTALTHYAGKLHMKKIRAYMKKNHSREIEVPKALSFEQKICEVCSVTLTSEMQSKQHFSGKTHQRNLKQPKLVEVPKTAYDPSGRFGIGQAFLQHEQKPHKELNPDSNKFYCETCNIHTTSEDQLKNHIKGGKHLKRLEVSNIDKDCSTQLSIYRTPSNQYYCPQCDVLSNSLKQFMFHVQSRKHKKCVK